MKSCPSRERRGKHVQHWRGEESRWCHFLLMASINVIPRSCQNTAPSAHWRARTRAPQPFRRKDVEIGTRRRLTASDARCGGDTEQLPDILPPAGSRIEASRVSFMAVFVWRDRDAAMDEIWTSTPLFTA